MDLYMLWIDLLEPTGYVMHHQFNIQQLYALPRWKVFTARYGLGI